jgi:hypothetical protein
VSQQHVVVLSPAERARLAALIRRDGATALQQRRARILLHADRAGAGPRSSDRAVAAAVGVDARTVARTRARFAADGLEAVLTRRPRADRGPRLVDGAVEARLTALACSTPPAGFARWSLRLLAHRAVELEIVEGISHETVRATLKKTCSSRG